MSGLKLIYTQRGMQIDLCIILKQIWVFQILNIIFKLLESALLTSWTLHIDLVLVFQSAFLLKINSMPIVYPLSSLLCLSNIFNWKKCLLQNFIVFLCILVGCINLLVNVLYWFYIELYSCQVKQPAYIAIAMHMVLYI